MGDHLTGDVVDVDVELDRRPSRVRSHGGGRGGVADDHLYHVGPSGGVGATGAVADRRHVHRRQRPERCGEGDEGGDTRRRRQLQIGVDTDHGHVARGEQPGHRRRRVGQAAVGRRDRAPAGRHGTGDELVDLQRRQGGGDADDVDDGVDGADLVELHVPGIDTVDGSFGGGEGVEHRLRPVADEVGQVGGLEQLADLPRRAVRVVVVVVDDDVGPRGRHAAALHPLEGQRVAVDTQTTERLVHRAGVGAGVDEGAEEHVAGDAGAALHVGDSRRAHVALRSIRATAHAAPKPLSMPTTVTPLAHDDSIASNAVTPSSAAP